MKAICIKSRPDLGKIGEVLECTELPIPELRRNEVRIRVLASTVNIDDIHFAEGTMFGGLPLGRKPRGNRPYVPGTDVSGVVDAVGPGVTSLSPGEEVYGICNPMSGRGSWAEYCIAKSHHVATKPALWSFEEAAACGVAGSVSVCMVNSARDVVNRKCLVVGASGGIGTLLLQALKTKNARIWGVCSHRNTDTVRKLGAERVIDYTQGPFSEQIRDLGEEVDVVFDLVGGKDIEREAMTVLSSTGAFVTIVGPTKYAGERKIGAIGALSSLAYAGWRMLWTRIRNGPSYSLSGPTEMDFASINALLVASASRPVIDTEVSLSREEVLTAINRVVSHRAAGKVIIRV